MDDFTSNCFLNPSTCHSGLSFGFWIKWIQWKDTSIVSSPFIGIQHLTDEMVPAALWDGTHQWSIFENRKVDDAWHCHLLTWNKTKLQLYVDKRLVFTDSNPSTMKTGLILGSQAKPKRLALGNTARDTRLNSTVSMYMDDFSVWERPLTQRDVETFCTTG